MLDKIIEEYSKKDGYKQIGYEVFVKRLMSKYDAVEYEYTDDYINDFLEDEKIKSVYLVNNNDGKKFNVFSKQIEDYNDLVASSRVDKTSFYYQIMLGEMFVICIIDIEPDYTFKVIGQSDILLDELTILKGISKEDALDKSPNFIKYLRACINTGRIKW